MRRILFIFSILTLSYSHSSAQNKDFNFDRIIISRNGDSLIKQEYELIIKTKKVYFITPFASYLHIKGEKYRTRVKFDKSKKEKIFNLVDNLTWTNLVETYSPKNGDCFYIIKTFNADELIGSYRISEESLPNDFNTLYENISDRK